MLVMQWKHNLMIFLGEVVARISNLFPVFKKNLFSMNYVKLAIHWHSVGTFPDAE